MKQKSKKTQASLYGRIQRSEASIQALTGLNIEEFKELAKELADVWDQHYENYTLEGKPRQRRMSKAKDCPLPSIEDKLLFICAYLKAYPIQDLHAAVFGMDQSHANVWIHRLAGLLFKALGGLKHLPERNGQSLQYLLESSEQVYLDGTERPVQRSRDDNQQREDYSGKQKDHTKENLVLCTATQKVVFLSKTYPGSTVDITMARQENMRLPRGIKLLVDLGFLGFILSGVKILLPNKKPRNGELTQEQKDYNVLVASARVVNEHCISGIKRCRSVKDRLRNWKPGFDDLVMCLAAGLHNLRVASRPTYATVL